MSPLLIFTLLFIQLMRNPLLFSVETLCCCQRREYSRVTLWALCCSVSLFIPWCCYLDDGSLGGSLSDVLHDVQLVEKLGSNLGLQLNCSKSEIICEKLATRDTMLQAGPGLHVLNQDAADILGSPVGNIEHVGRCHLGESGSVPSHGGPTWVFTLTMLFFYTIVFPSRIFSTYSGQLQVFFHLTLMLMTACSDHFLVISSM